MGWLLELLFDGIREICSQFIVDMMELTTNMFTELLSCDLSLFESLFSVVGALYQNVIVPMGIAILLLILVWQLLKGMFGRSVNGEEPVELLIRSAIALFFVVAAKPAVNYILRFAGTPYQWVVGTEIKTESFSEYVTTLEEITGMLGIGSLSISILMLIMQFVVAWNYFKMLFVIAERYVLLGVFSYTAPLAFSTGGSKSTNNILSSWSKMFGGQVVLIILNAWCMKMFLSGYGNMMASGYGFTKFFAATLCLVGFCKITFKLDSYLASLGVNLGRPSAGMGAMGLVMAASRIFSRLGQGGWGDGSESGASGGGGTDPSGPAGGGQMTEGFTGPIPMRADSSGSMDFDGMPSGDAFGQEKDGASGSDGASYPPEEGKGEASSVFEEIGVVSSEPAGSAGIDPGMRTEGGGSSMTGRDDFGETTVSSEHGVTGGQAGETESRTSMDMGISAIPGYSDSQSAPGAPGTEPPVPQGTSAEPGRGGAEIWPSEAGNSENGILGELGDYPVEEDFSEPEEDRLMELDSSGIESMGGGVETDGVSYGAAGDAFGNASLEGSGGKRSGGTAPGDMSMAGSGAFDRPGGILSELESGYEDGGMPSYETEHPGTEPVSATVQGLHAEGTDTLPGLGRSAEFTSGAEEADAGQDLDLSGFTGSSLDGTIEGTAPKEPEPEDDGMQERKTYGAAMTVTEAGLRETPMEDFDGVHNNPETERDAGRPLEDGPIAEDGDGQMSGLDLDETIPHEGPQHKGRQTTSRSAWEVPKTRDELKRWQQGRDGFADGTPPY